MRKTLVNIAKKLNDTSEIWLLAGRTAAILQGAVIPAKKLTLYTTEKDSYKFGSFFNEYKKERVKYREHTPLSGHSGLFIINDIEISIIGAPEINHQHRKYLIPVEDIFLEAESTILDGQDIPMLPGPWLILLGIMGKDEELAKSVIDTGIEKKNVMTIAERLGVSYFIENQVNHFYGQTQK